MSSSPEVVVLGLGNILMEDEGIGVHAANHLQEHYHFKPEIEIVDGGTSGLDLLTFFGPEKSILIIDAVNFDMAPGTVAKLEDDAILAQLDPKVSLHHLGLSDLIGVAELTDRKAKRMTLLGIQPESMENLDLEMTPTIKGVFDKVIENALLILEEWGIENHKH
ncbi:MAG: HyaD/HybD family hydrogenase maturation endopeptidase [FCB group bacterium]|nr:HyaD/HybD family hydrogenase maturation endopeptidase [FCB group bacterium]MBL7027839.1 HyaD/HybD family hydrogenase maturation endopeptidase [Candidatus Neomarinimicrobiota bacterium]MBL7120920.1 HyaD/HybD family hydrogenase maturation endopeptidase [Candidatus Neomarinimicrobiota bacterium]